MASVGKQRNMMLDTTLKSAPAKGKAPTSVKNIDVDEVFQKPPKKEAEPEKEVSLEVKDVSQPAPVPAPEPEPAPPTTMEAQPAPPAPAKKKRECSDKLKAHLAKARAKSLEVRRQRAAAKKQELQAAKQVVQNKKVLEKIPEEPQTPIPVPQQRQQPPVQSRPVPPTSSGIDYDQIINGVVSRMQFNNEVDDEALNLLTQDIRREEQAKAHKAYEERLAKLEREKKGMYQANQAVGILRGQRPKNRVFERRPVSQNPLRGADNPYDRCFKWNN